MLTLVKFRPKVVEDSKVVEYSLKVIDIFSYYYRCDAMGCQLSGNSTKAFISCVVRVTPPNSPMWVKMTVMLRKSLAARESVKVIDAVWVHRQSLKLLIIFLSKYTRFERT